MTHNNINLTYNSLIYAEKYTICTHKYYLQLRKADAHGEVTSICARGTDCCRRRRRERRAAAEQS